MLDSGLDPELREKIEKEGIIGKIDKSVNINGDIDNIIVSHQIFSS